MLRTRRTEEGSLAIAMSIVLILSVLSAAILLRAINTSSTTRQDQDFSAALGGADASVSDALFQLDQKVTPISNTTVCGSALRCFKNSGTSGSTTWSYTALQSAADSNVYTLRGRGVTNGRAHDVAATLKRETLFPYQLFATSTITFSGSSCPDGSIPASIGASGSISTPCATNNDCFLPGACSTAGDVCSPTVAPPCLNNVNKTNPQPAPGVTGPPSGPEVPTTGLTPCPLSAGKWDIIGTVSPGTYVCRTGAIKLAGSIAPITGGKFKLYVMSPATIDIDRGTDVFNGVDVGSNTTCSPAVNFQVYSDAPGTWTWNGQAPHVCGTFYVPNISISMPGDKFSLTGAIIAKSFDINGAPHGIFPDNSTAEIVKTDWTMSSYREVGTTCTTNC